MIGLLIGTIAYRSDPYVIVNVHGVGYRVFVSNPTYASLQSVDTEITIYTHTHVREDVLDLFGFLDPLDLKLFEYLISVSGIGCKTAMGIFSVGKRSEILNAIVKANVNFFQQTPRLGKKNAQKIIIELKSKLGSNVDLDLNESGSDNATVVEALKQFGYRTSEIQKVLQSIKDDLSESEQIRLALQQLGKG